MGRDAHWLGAQGAEERTMRESQSLTLSGLSVDDQKGLKDFAYEPSIWYTSKSKPNKWIQW